MNRVFSVSLAAVAFAALAVALSACDDVGPLGPFQPCAKTAAPVTTEEVIAALRQHGFSVEPDSYGCNGAVDVHVVVSNFTDQESYDANEHEGFVYCAIRSHPLWGDAVIIKTQKRSLVLNPKVFGNVLNVDCQLSDGDDLPSAEQVARLRAALEQMRAPQHHS